MCASQRTISHLFIWQCIVLHTQVLECLEDMNFLEVLTLEGNPCSEAPYYR